MASGAGVVSRDKASINASYGATKVSTFATPVKTPWAEPKRVKLIVQASNVFLARYAHHENPDLVSFALSPGWVKT